MGQRIRIVSIWVVERNRFDAKAHIYGVLRGILFIEKAKNNTAGGGIEIDDTTEYLYRYHSSLIRFRLTTHLSNKVLKCHHFYFQMLYPSRI